MLQGSTLRGAHRLLSYSAKLCRLWVRAPFIAGLNYAASNNLASNAGAGAYSRRVRHKQAYFLRVLAIFLVMCMLLAVLQENGLAAQYGLKLSYPAF